MQRWHAAAHIMMQPGSVSCSELQLVVLLGLVHPPRGQCAGSKLECYTCVHQIPISSLQLKPGFPCRAAVWYNAVCMQRWHLCLFAGPVRPKTHETLSTISMVTNGHSLLRQQYPDSLLLEDFNTGCGCKPLFLVSARLWAVGLQSVDCKHKKDAVHTLCQAITATSSERARIAPKHTDNTCCTWDAS